MEEQSPQIGTCGMTSKKRDSRKHEDQKIKAHGFLRLTKMKQAWRPGLTKEKCSVQQGGVGLDDDAGLR